MREEVIRVVAKHGWTKAGVSHMYKVDSFIKENIRLLGVGSGASLRLN